MHPLLTQRRQKLKEEQISFYELQIEKRLHALIELCQSESTANIPGLKKVGENLVNYADLLQQFDPQTIEGRKLRLSLIDCIEQLTWELAQTLQSANER